jgi:hypothetical protein
MTVATKHSPICLHCLHRGNFTISTTQNAHSTFTCIFCTDCIVLVYQQGGGRHFKHTRPPQRNQTCVSLLTNTASFFSVLINYEHFHATYFVLKIIQLPSANTVDKRYLTLRGCFTTVKVNKGPRSAGRPLSHRALHAIRCPCDGDMIDTRYAPRKFCA